MDPRATMARPETDGCGAVVSLTVRRVRRTSSPHLRAITRHFAHALTLGRIDALRRHLYCWAELTRAVGRASAA